MRYNALMLLLMYVQSAFAGGIYGRISNEVGLPLPGANIYLLTADSQFVEAALTDGHGMYAIDSIAAGTYMVRILATGHMPYTARGIVVSGASVKCDASLPLATELGDVVVRAQQPFAEMRDGKIIVNLSNSIISAGSSVLEALTRAPGVKADQNDNILLKGKPGVLILLDGRRMPMAGTDLANVLRAMPADQVERIEIIANPPARYDAAGSAGIINIITKRGGSMGMNGTVNGSYGQGVYPKSNVGAGLNYRSGKVGLYANAAYTYRKGINYQLLDRHFFEGGRETLRYDQEDNALFPINTLSGAAGIDYKLTPKTTIGMSATGSTTRYNVSGSNRSLSLNADDSLLWWFETTNTSRDQWHNYAANANLQHTFDSVGHTLTVDIDHATYGNNTMQDFYVRYYTPAGGQYLPPYHLHGDLRGTTSIWSARVDHTINIRKLRFDAGLKSSYVQADNEPLFYDRSAGGNVYDTTKSNHFIYTERINAAYSTLTGEWEKWSMQAGLRAEQTIASGSQLTTGTTFWRNYAQLFPSLWVQHKVNARHEVGLTLSRRIERPVYKQLNPFKFFVDPTEYDEGNPYLLPALSYSAELSHTFRGKFITTFSASITNGVITEVVKTDEHNDKINAQVEVNLNRLTWYSLGTAYPFGIAKWWVSTINANLYYCHYDGSFAGTGLNRGRPSLDLNIINSITLPAAMRAEVSLFYQAPQVYAFMDMGQYWSLNAGIQKSLRNKNVIIKLNTTDIFWRSTITGTSHYINYWQSFVNRRDARVVTLSLTWKWGKHSVPAIDRKEGSAVDEKKRAG